MWIRCIIYMKCVPLTIRFQTTKQNDVIAALIQSASFMRVLLSFVFICIIQDCAHQFAVPARYVIY